MKKSKTHHLEGAGAKSDRPLHQQNQASYSSEKLSFGFSFSAADGELGNQSEDNNDLPKLLKKVGHQYNPNISEQNANETFEENEITGAMHIADKHSVGLGYSEGDAYLDKE